MCKSFGSERPELGRPDKFESELDTSETSVERELLALLIKGVAGDELTNVCFSSVLKPRPPPHFRV